ncbi:hypothetical protein [Actinoplanes solisilvae]|uniref:hypothetical protein n=1 Tax=Actinoplanes solisilvae TaxID=2486853 RepID=UPI000FD7B064|nr:hypothetical protein [Actinoplanes solisilvae]
MTVRTRPLLSVRLIGRPDVVAEQKAYLIAHLRRTLGDRTVCRTSTHPADYRNDIRVYLTVKEVPRDD